MQVDDDLESVVACPSDGLLKVWKLASDEWLTGTDFECPVANWDPDVVQPAYEESTLHLREHATEASVSSVLRLPHTHGTRFWARGKAQRSKEKTHPAAAIAAKSASV